MSTPTPTVPRTTWREPERAARSRTAVPPGTTVGTRLPPHVLLPVRTGGPADALVEAVDEAARRGAGLLVLHVLDAPGRPAVADAAQAARRLAEAERLVAAVRDQARRLTGGRVPVTTEVAHREDPVEAVLRRAGSSTSLVVFPPSSTAPGGGAGIDLAEAVSARCSRPVMVLPPGPLEDGVPAPVVVGLRRTSAPDDALRAGLRLARGRHCDLVAVHACGRSDGPGIRRDLVAVLERLRTAVTPLLADYPDVMTEVVVTARTPLDALGDAGARSCVVVLGRPHGDLLHDLLPQLHRPVVVVAGTPLATEHAR